MISIATTSGSANKTPDEKIIPPALAMFNQVLLAAAPAPIGSTAKLFPSVAMTMRWPLIAMNMSNASTPRNSDITGVEEALAGSYAVANPSPIELLIIMPAMSTALKTRRMENPMAKPMTIC